MTTELNSEQKLDFVFISPVCGKPYRVRWMDEDYWICWMHPDKNWVTLRKVEGSPELWHMQNACVDFKHRSHYELGIQFEGIWPSHDAPEIDLRFDPDSKNCSLCANRRTVELIPSSKGSNDSLFDECPWCLRRDNLNLKRLLKEIVECYCRDGFDEGFAVDCCLVHDAVKITGADLNLRDI